MKNKQNKLDQIEHLLATNEEQPKTETIAELRSQGIDTTQFFTRIRTIVQSGYSEQLRIAAQQEQSIELELPQFLNQLATMSREGMLAIFAQLRNGTFGDEYQEAAVARCRNKDASLLSDDELRSWLEDVGNIFGSPPDEK